MADLSRYTGAGASLGGTAIAGIPDGGIEISSSLQKMIGRYDGNLNPTNGMAYTIPISLNETTVVRAAAFKSNQVPSIARAQSYLFTDDIIHQSANNQPPTGWPSNGSSTLNGQYMDYGMDPAILSQYGAAAVKDALTSISTISINTDLANLFDQQDGLYSNAQNRGRGTEKFTSVELVEPDGSPGFQANAGLRIRLSLSTPTRDNRRSNAPCRRITKSYLRDTSMPTLICRPDLPS